MFSFILHITQASGYYSYLKVYHVFIKIATNIMLQINSYTFSYTFLEIIVISYPFFEKGVGTNRKSDGKIR